MKRLMLLSSALIFSASMSFAAVTAESLVADYQAQGFTRIEVTTGLTQFKVEAVKGDTKVEVIYDATTGNMLDQEISRAKRKDARTGVELSIEDHDFLDSDDDSDDGDDDGDHSDDDSNDDHGGHGAGNDHDGDGDHDRGHGNDDDGHDEDNPGRGRGHGGNDD